MSGTYKSRNQEGLRAGERAPLLREDPLPRYGANQIPPPYAPIPDDGYRGYENTHADHFKPNPPPSDRRILIIIGSFIVILFFAIQLLAVDLYSSNIPARIRRLDEAIAQNFEQEHAMRAEAKHLESERVALRGEHARLEKERLAIESCTLKMEGERQALESTIHNLEQEELRLEKKKWLLEAEQVRLKKQQQLMEGERSRLESEKHLLETERQSLENQELALREERERWERARDEQTIPQGAFWDPLWPVWECRAYGQREYWGILRNIPPGRSEMDACMNMPAEIKGVTIRRPHRCQYFDGSIRGFWMVDWDQPDCRPWHQDFVNKVSLGYPGYPTLLRNAYPKGCTNWGSGLLRLEAEVVGINNKGEQDWRLLCETTPMIWSHITYTSPAHCEASIVFSPKISIIC